MRSTPEMVKDNEQSAGAAGNTEAEDVTPERGESLTVETVDQSAGPQNAEAGQPVAQADVLDTSGAPVDESADDESINADRSGDRTVDVSSESADAVADPAGDPFAGVAMSTTTLIFHAPAIAPLPALTRDDRPDLDDDDEDDDERGSNVRRRSRRRRGEDGGRGSGEQQQSSNRGRPQREPELITEPQRVKGSTRLEAKKQRRRDGRDAGRRRTVVTEAEFLARRESVDRAMVVRSKDGRIQIGVLEDGVLVEHYVARNQDASLIGNVYLGRVQNVLPSMEAAFVDIGRGRNAVLYSGEVDWDAAAENSSEGKNQPRRIELALKPGDKVLVQVTKDPVGHKGARLTSQVSLPGRYLVYVPNGSMNGISRKLPDTERARLKRILKEVLPESSGVIVRTAAEGATEEQLTVDVNRLTSQWTEISHYAESAQAPALLHSEPDLLIKIVRDVFNEDFQRLVIAGDDALETIETYVRQVAPDLVDRIERYEGQRDVFDEFRVSEQIEKALDRKVWLPSGGSLVIDRTEAMTVVDVNTGKFVGSGGNLEETVTKNNLEAAEEIVRQLRLRDIGGIIVVDFIDMVLESNRDLVLRRLVECLSRDRTKHQVAEVTTLGLVQMTRKKLGLGLLESFSEPCETCAGRGVIVHHEPVAKGGRPVHSSGGQQNGSDRRRKGGQNGNGGANGGQNAPQQAPAAKAAPHAITDDAKNALAQIAASTIHHTGASAADESTDGQVEKAQPTVESIDAVEVDGTALSVEATLADAGSAVSGSAVSGSADTDSVETGSTAASGSPDNDAELPSEDAAVAATEPVERRAPRTREPRKGRRGGRASSDSVLGPVETREPSGSPLAILDIPIAPAGSSSQRVDKRAAEDLLGSVLDALPEPKRPGRGRGRSRRVTTAALTGTPISHEDEQG
ncbi:Rne/Rng family ribonuclease [Labedella gwakjiensis]|uniref:Rne/Rng family ribonuclease n=2 Tax=Labedella gwakjiensis TaxID=390269 RepID=A0ABY0C8F6_9MICO|nr:Rne/Rng family ribonuclease [Labedella gwakjiensis]